LAEAEGTPGPVTVATAAKLARLGMLDDPAGQVALVMARRLDFGFTDSGAGVASVSRELRAALEAVAAGAPAGLDTLDELARRRAARRQRPL
jgi:hypothetical protein